MKDDKVMFTWMSFFEELADKISSFRDKQKELTDTLRKTGLYNNGLTDKDSEGNLFPMVEVDPFTYFSLIMKFGIEKRQKVVASLKKDLEIKADLPKDFNGVPSSMAQKAWLISYKATRNPKDISILWDLFEAALKNDITDPLFKAALEVQQVGFPKLTQGLFWIRPRLYFPIDTQTKPFLQKHAIDYECAKRKSYSDYSKCLKDIKSKFPDVDFYELSQRAWYENQGSGPSETPEKKGNDQPITSKRYWTYSPGTGARFWDSHYQEGIMTIGWDFLGNLKKIPDKEQLRLKMQSNYGDTGSQKNRVLACYDFCHTMKKGDVVFAKKGRNELIGYGIVGSDYMFDDSRPEHKHVRKVDWVKKGNWHTENKTALKTLTDITKYTDFVDELKRTIKLDVTGPDQISVEKSYWWLNANPKIWNFIDTPVGERQIYTAYNIKGNKRRIFKYFEAVNPGDTILGYVASPNREIVAECRVTKELHKSDEGLGIEFEKKVQFLETVSLEELKAIPELSGCEPLINNQGSLFKVTDSEYEIIRAILDDKNDTHTIKPYSIESSLETIFIDESKFHNILDRIKFKKNLVLQGPPGVGKTFIATHIAYALMGVEDKRRTSMIQFHQSYSYEDFMQGFRPNSEAKFDLKNGAFYEFCRKAQRDPGNPYVFIIDEINRGNLSKIFGEMFMLIEADKRGPDYAMPLTYAQSLYDTFFIPDNLYIIGTMNTADRSLAMVDYALRRRFCFINLEPAFGNEKFKKFLVNRGVEETVVDKVIDRMMQLNKRIAEDQKNLGRGYCVGHSYLCPSDKHQVYDNAWYENVVRTEIEPLLEEYWFDDPDKARKRVEQLLS